MDEFVLRPRVMSPWANNLWRLRPPPVADTGSRSASAAVEIGNGESRARRFRAPQRYGRKFESSSRNHKESLVIRLNDQAFSFVSAIRIKTCQIRFCRVLSCLFGRQMGGTGAFRDDAGRLADDGDDQKQGNSLKRGIAIPYQ